MEITPCLWFDDNAEDAVKFYTHVFHKGKIIEIKRYGEGAPRPAGTAMSVTFRLLNQDFIALNGGPEYKFTPAVSFMVVCETQLEVNYLWKSLSEGGEKGRCGWLKDKFGLSWQVVPQGMGDLLGNDESGKVMQAMLAMDKLDIDVLREAAKQS